MDLKGTVRICLLTQCRGSSGVERVLGKDEVAGSNPARGSKMESELPGGQRRLEGGRYVIVWGSGPPLSATYK